MLPDSGGIAVNLADMAKLEVRHRFYNQTTANSTHPMHLDTDSVDGNTVTQEPSDHVVHVCAFRVHLIERKVARGKRCGDNTSV